MRLALISLVFPLALGAQTLQTSRVGDLSSRIDSLFATVVTKDAPGAAVLVISNGRVAHQKGYGLADLATKRPIDGSTTFDLASVSKQFTTMAIMMLAERGKRRACRTTCRRSAPIRRRTARSRRRAR